MKTHWILGSHDKVFYSFEDRADAEEMLMTEVQSEIYNTFCINVYLCGEDIQKVLSNPQRYLLYNTSWWIQKVSHYEKGD